MADWDINNPADDGIVSQYPANERAQREAVMDIFDGDHISAEGSNQGKHRASRYVQLGSDPAAVAGQTVVYVKDVGGIAEIFFRYGNGTIVQLTNGGKINVGLVADAVDTEALQDGILANSAAGRLKMEEGFFQNLTTALDKFATGFWSASSLARSKFADGFVTAAMLQDTYLQQQATTVSLNGDFSTGSVRCVRVGDMVTITSTGPVSASSSMFSASTGSGRIPSAYRPTGSDVVTCVYEMTSGQVRRVDVATNGTLRTLVRNWDGSSATALNFGRISISYSRT